MGIVVLGQLVAAGWLPHRRYTSLVRGNILFLSEDIYFIVNPAKRNVMVVKNEMRLLKQKRNVLQI